MKSFKSLVLNLRYFIKPFTKKSIQSPFIPYDGDYEADMEKFEKLKPKPFSEKFAQQKISFPFPEKISSPFSEKISTEVLAFLSRKDHNLSDKSLKLLQKTLENKCKDQEVIESIFLLTFLLDDPLKKLKNYPNLSSFQQKFSLNSQFLNSIIHPTQEFLKKELLKKTMSLRYFSKIRLSIKELLYLIYSLEVASRPLSIESVLDQDLVITLINSVICDKKDDIKEISPKETTYLLSVCRNYCFSDIEMKNQAFNTFLLELLEKKVESMTLQDIFYLVKELNQISIENTHFSQKEKFLPLIERIQKNLLLKLTGKSKLKDYESSLLGVPDFYFNLTRIFTKIGVISMPLMNCLEKSFLSNARNFNFKLAVIAFNFFTNLGGGANILETIKKNFKNGGFFKQIQAFDQFYLVQFLLKITILEISEFWNSIKLQKEATLNFSYFTHDDFMNSKEKTQVFFDSNFEIIGILLKIILENKKKQPFSKEIKANMVRILEFLNYTNRLNQLKQREDLKKSLEELISDMKDEEIEFYRNENNYYNQFNADINSILMKNQIQFENEKKFVYRYCDIYLPHENIVLELDGKFHFYLNNKEEVLISNKCRNVFILMKEARLFEISIYDWEKNREKQEMERIFMEKINFLIKNKEIVFLK